MNMDQVEAGMTEVLKELFARDGLIASPDLTAAELCGGDSFKRVDLIMAAEERFGIRHLLAASVEETTAARRSFADPGVFAALTGFGPSSGVAIQASRLPRALGRSSDETFLRAHSRLPGTGGGRSTWCRHDAGRYCKNLEVFFKRSSPYYLCN